MRSAQPVPGPAVTAGRPGAAGGAARPGRAWRLAGLAAAGWVLLFTGIVIGTASSGGRAADTPAPPEPAAVDGTSCAQAIARANESLAMAVRVERALADRTRLRQLEASGQLTPGRSRQLDAVAEQRGAMAASRFDALLAGYLEAADGCQARPR